MIHSAMVLAWMLRLSPNVPHADFPFIAEAIAQVANEDSNPLDAAATLTAIGRFESNFDLYALSKPEDTTTSLGVFQLSTRWIRFPISPYEQAATALWLIRDSQFRCGTLAEYTSGNCYNGIIEAADRSKLAVRLQSEMFFEPALPIFKKRTYEEL